MTSDRNYSQGLFGDLFRGWWLAIFLTVIALLVYEDALPDLAREFIFASLPDTGVPFKTWDWLKYVTEIGELLDGLPLVLLSLPGAWLVDRFGPRRVARWGVLVAVVGYLTLIGAQPVNWVMYLSIALLIVGATVGFTWVPAATLNNWFQRRKATAMAVPLFGFALWRVAIDPAANSLIGLLGWRLAVTVVGASALAVVMPLAWQIRDRPEDHGLYPDGASPDPDTVLPDYTWREAVRSRSFWLLVAGDGCLFSVGLASWMLARPFPFFHYDEVYPFDGYYPWGVIFDVNTSRMVASTAAVLACAVIGDRVPVRYVLAGLALLLAGSLILLATETPGSRFIFGVLSGIAMGGGQAIRISARGTYFGRKSFTTITATGLLCVLPFYVATIATLFRLYDLTREGLTMPAAAGLVVCLFGALGYLLAGTPQLAPSQQLPAEG